jgi:esterase/lipase
MKFLKIATALVLILTIIYLSGPHPKAPVYSSTLPSVPSITILDSFISAQEAQHKLRPNNEARVVWANDSSKQKTPYAIVYLHGFSASQEEGNPVHENVAKAYNCNLYLARLDEHGIDTSEQLMNLNAEDYWESAKQALAIGKQLGEKVILMGTSTGGTQALQLAAAFPNDVAGLILYSPNIAINDGNAWMLNNPWGLQIARLVKKGNYNDPEDTRPIYSQYWNKPYRLEALVALEDLIETTMNKETFAKIVQPTLVLYYFKDDAHQDNVVKVSAIQQMFDQLSTPKESKRSIALPKTGNHVIASPIKSNDIVSVETETKNFLTEIMHLKVK